MSNIDTPKNSPIYPPNVLRMQGKSQTRYSSLKRPNFTTTQSFQMSQPFFLEQILVDKLYSVNPILTDSVFKLICPREHWHNEDGECRCLQILLLLVSVYKLVLCWVVDLAAGGPACLPVPSHPGEHHCRYYRCCKWQVDIYCLRSRPVSPNVVCPSVS